MVLSYSSPNGLRLCYKCKDKENAMLVPDSDPGHNFPTSFLNWATSYVTKKGSIVK